MRYVHLIFGILMFAVFTITGRYMRADFPEKDAIPPEFRILMRSRHIYILFSALIHIGLGLYMQLRPLIVQKILQISGSAVLVYSSVTLVWAFAVETYQLQHFSNLSRSGIYASLAGIGLHLIGGLGKRSSG
jgi:hypothetical protein